MKPVSTIQSGLPVRANRLGGLQQVVDLRQRDVRIGIVDQRVEIVRAPPTTSSSRRSKRRYSAFLRDDEYRTSGARD